MKGKQCFMITKDDTMKAVYNDDLVDLLKRINFWEKFKNGEISCKYCNSIISRSNLYAILPTDPISFCCNSPSCVFSLTEEAQK